MRKAPVFIVLALVLVLCAAPVYANGVPPLPHAFHGGLTVNNSPAPAGTQVEARGEGVTTGIEGNPIVTTDVGSYGSATRLVVQGDIVDGATLTFYVNGVSTEQTAAWHSGETTELDLSVTIAVPAGGGGGVSPFGAIDTNLFGSVADFLINEAGVILEPITATSADGNLTMTIPAGTTALDADGNPLSTLTSAVDVSPPPPPEGANIIELAYNFGPAGATFDPAITFEYTYDPANIAEGVAEGDLVLAYYDEAAGEWVELPSTVDPVTHTITASVSHFTTFAIIAPPAPPPPPAPAEFKVSDLSVKPAEVEPGETVTITVSVANTGGTEGSYAVILKINDVKEAEKSVTVAPGESQDVSFNVTREEAASYTVSVDGLSGSFTVVAPAPEEAPPEAPPAKPGPNWPMIGGIIAAVVAVALVIFFRRRRA